jgi:hypothetical protein
MQLVRREVGEEVALQLLLPVPCHSLHWKLEVFVDILQVPVEVEIRALGEQPLVVAKRKHSWWESKKEG